MASTESGESKGHHHPHPTTTPVSSVACRMLRSPSHESVTTDLSLFSVSSLASDAAAAAAAAGAGGRGMRLVTFKSYSEAQLAARGPSPNPDSRGHAPTRPADIPEILWFEEENELIRSCAALSSALGLQKSFSTSDISQLPSPEEPPSLPPPRCAVSELALSAVQRSGFLLEHPHLDHASRSCSTWVAVGDVASTSQLPSPHGGHSTTNTAGAGAAPSVAAGATAAPSQPQQQPTSQPGPPAPAFTAADLIRSVNKKVRQNYIRRRLLTTYKALERLSQSEFNLDRLEVPAATAAATAAAAAAATSAQSSSLLNASGGGAAATAATSGANANSGGGAGPANPGGSAPATHLTVPGAPPSAGAAAAAVTAAAASATAAAASANCTSAAVLRVVKQRASKNLPLTIRDVERERGKPLSKYERNMMIFNWLHTLDDSFEGLQ